MNLGEFRELTKSLPDDYEIVASGGDPRWYEVTLEDILHGIEGMMPGVVTLGEMQEVTEQFEIPMRLGLDDPE